MMNSEQKLKLNEMIDTNNTIDRTSEIRELKHSHKIRKDVTAMILLKKNNTDINKIENLAQSKCGFLYTNYPDIFNKLLKNGLDIDIMYMFLDVLKKIEEGKYDQHEGAFKVGTLLKKMYIDPSIEETKTSNYEDSPLTWKEYKLMKNL
jgi:hypothetical protein